MVYFDSPYGLGMDPEWDGEAFSAAKLEKLLGEVNSRQSAQNYLLVLWCIPWMLGEHMQVLDKLKFKGIHPFIWMKPNVQVKETLPQTPNFEIAVFAWSTACQLSPKSNDFYMLWQPEEKRYASIEIPIALPFTRFEGKSNPAEKPWKLAYTITKRFCLPGSSVLLIGPRLRR
jgi:hypothetical protein